MKYTQIPADTFRNLQMNAGILVTDFDPTDGSVEGLMGATTGGISFVSLDDTNDDTKQLSVRQHLILQMIQKDDTITIKEMTQKTNVSDITIKRDLAYLQKTGFLIREGGRKEGHWVIIIDR